MADLIRPRQRSLTAVSPHQGNENVLVPNRRRGGSRLTFAPDTVITTPASIDFIASAPGQVFEYNARADDLVTINLDAWGSSPSVTFYDRWRTNIDLRVFRGNSGGNNILTGFGEGVDLKVTVEMFLAGQARISLNDAVLATQTVGITDALGESLLIGNRPAGNGFNGSIWDFKIYSSPGVLAHHWPIDEGGGTVIRDIVGGLDGTLTLGGGSWS